MAAQCIWWQNCWREGNCWIRSSDRSSSLSGRPALCCTPSQRLWSTCTLKGYVTSLELVKNKWHVCNASVFRETIAEGMRLKAQMKDIEIVILGNRWGFVRLPHHWSYHILVYNGSDADKLHIRSQEGLIQTVIDEKACSIHCHSRVLKTFWIGLICSRLHLYD